MWRDRTRREPQRKHQNPLHQPLMMMMSPMLQQVCPIPLKNMHSCNCFFMKQSFVKFIHVLVLRIFLLNPVFGEFSAAAVASGELAAVKTAKSLSSATSCSTVRILSSGSSLLTWIMEIPARLFFPTLPFQCGSILFLTFPEFPHRTICELVHSTYIRASQYLEY